MLPVYFINLARSRDRASTMLSHLDALGIPAERIEAVDGTVLHPDQRNVYDPRPRARRGDPHLTASEIACFLSHREAWKRVAETGRAAVILEDDARLAPDTRAVASAIPQQITDNSIIRLGGNRRRAALPEAQIGARTLARLTAGPSGAFAYVIGPHVARALLDKSRTFSDQVDTFLDHALLRGVTTYAVLPYPALFDDATASTIGDERHFRERSSRETATISQAARRRLAKLSRSALKTVRVLICTVGWLAHLINAKARLPLGGNLARQTPHS